jgi:hypothetical protein
MPHILFLYQEGIFIFLILKKWPKKITLKNSWIYIRKTSKIFPAFVWKKTNNICWNENIDYELDSNQIYISNSFQYKLNHSSYPFYNQYFFGISFAQCMIVIIQTFHEYISTITLVVLSHCTISYDRWKWGWWMKFIITYGHRMIIDGWLIHLLIW